MFIGFKLQSFFTLFRNLFRRLAEDEARFSDRATGYPSFGYSTWTWTTSDTGNKKEGARFFYNFWLSFTTEKDFSWEESWNLNEAPDRRVRKLLEKENKERRQVARRDYNDIVIVSLAFRRVP